MFCFILKIYLFENKVTEIQRQRQRDLPCIDSFPRCPLRPRLCQAEARRQELHPGLRCGLNHYLLLARCISRKLDQKRSSQDLNMHSFVEGLRPRKQLSALYHCTHPDLLVYSFCPIQIRELEPLLCHSDGPSRLIWTSSRNARKSNFSLEDIQHSKGREPYSSSKYATDLLNVALNRRYNQQVSPDSVIRM